MCEQDITGGTCVFRRKGGIGSDVQLFQEMAVPKCNPTWAIDFDLVLMI